MVFRRARGPSKASQAPPIKYRSPSPQITRRCERRITARRSLIVLAAPAMARGVLAVSSMAALILAAAARAVALRGHGAGRAEDLGFRIEVVMCLLLITWSLDDS